MRRRVYATVADAILPSINDRALTLLTRLYPALREEIGDTLLPWALAHYVWTGDLLLPAFFPDLGGNIEQHLAVAMPAQVYNLFDVGQ